MYQSAFMKKRFFEWTCWWFWRPHGDLNWGFENIWNAPNGFYFGSRLSFLRRVSCVIYIHVLHTVCHEVYPVKVIDLQECMGEGFFVYDMFVHFAPRFAAMNHSMFTHVTFRTSIVFLQRKCRMSLQGNIQWKGSINTQMTAWRSISKTCKTSVLLEL